MSGSISIYGLIKYTFSVYQGRTLRSVNPNIISSNYSPQGPTLDIDEASLINVGVAPRKLLIMAWLLSR